jgi:cysteine-rich repeat protein
VPSGPEFQANTYTTDSQGRFNGPRVASAADGSFVVVWEDQGDYKIAARQFNGASAPLGPELVVANGAYELNPAVASDTAGNFVVVWGDYEIYARRFDSSGTAIGSEFQVNTSPYGRNPKVAADATGDFVVVWSGYDYNNPIRAQRFTSVGTPVGGEFQVNTYTTHCCGYSNIDEDHDGIEVASDAAGNFMVVWSRGFSSTRAIAGRAFDSSGAPAGPDFQVNVDSLGYDPHVGVAADETGRFIAVWRNRGSGIRGRRFDLTGTAVGGEFQVNDVPSGFAPSVSADPAGNFVVVWADAYGVCRDPGPGCDGDLTGVFGRQFDSTGAPVGSDFQVNTYSFDYQTLPSVAAASNGDFVVVWESYYQDGDDFGIFGQRFADSGPAGCSWPPKENCRLLTAAGKGTLLLKDKSPDKQDRLSWKWRKGTATSLYSFGDPLTETNYAVCIYDASTEPQPILQARAPAGGDCPGRPCWRLTLGSERIEYKDRDLDPDGLLSLLLRAGDEGKTQIKAKGKGENLDMPQLPLTPPVIVQAQASNGNCWEATYSDFILKNRSDQFRAKPDAPPCGIAAAPACNGECPAGQECAANGSSCQCLLPCGDVAAPACEGACPEGLSCEDGGGACACLPPCGSASAPACNGACPVGKQCNPVGLGCVCAACGNVDLEPGEQCDDGNVADGDGCSGACLCNPATTPAVCNLTGEWDEIEFGASFTITEDAAGNSTISGSVAGIPGATFDGQATRSDSCGAGTAAIAGPTFYSIRTMVGDSCNTMTVVIENFFLGSPDFAFRLVRQAPSPSGAFLDGAAGPLD